MAWLWFLDSPAKLKLAVTAAAVAVAFLLFLAALFLQYLAALLSPLAVLLSPLAALPSPPAVLLSLLAVLLNLAAVLLLLAVVAVAVFLMNQPLQQHLPLRLHLLLPKLQHLRLATTSVRIAISASATVFCEFWNAKLSPGAVCAPGSIH